MPRRPRALPNRLRQSPMLTSSGKPCPPELVKMHRCILYLSPFQINFAVVAESDSEDEHDYEDAAVHHYP